MNKKGISLTELLAVVVIIGIIASVAIVLVSTLISNARKRACEANKLVVFEQARIDLYTNNDYDVNDLDSFVDFLNITIKKYDFKCISKDELYVAKVVDGEAVIHCNNHDGLTLEIEETTLVKDGLYNELLKAVNDGHEDANIIYKKITKQNDAHTIGHTWQDPKIREYSGELTIIMDGSSTEEIEKLDIYLPKATINIYANYRPYSSQLSITAKEVNLYNIKLDAFVFINNKSFEGSGVSEDELVLNIYEPLITNNQAKFKISSKLKVNVENVKGINGEVLNSDEVLNIFQIAVNKEDVVINFNEE